MLMHSPAPRVFSLFGRKLVVNFVGQSHGHIEIPAFISQAASLWGIRAQFGIILHIPS